MPETRIALTVKPDDIDELGHVNNARLLEFFERGRMDWYTGAGGFLASKPGRRLGTGVVRITVDYRRECFSGDRLTVVTRAHSRKRSSYVIGQTVLCPDGSVAADARVTSVVMDLDTRRAVALPAELAREFPAAESRSANTAGESG